MKEPKVYDKHVGMESINDRRPWLQALTRSEPRWTSNRQGKTGAAFPSPRSKREAMTETEPRCRLAWTQKHQHQ